MQIQEVKISNFKGIDEWNIKFKPGFNLIIGENGRGKTSILEAIAVGLGGYVAGIPDVGTRHIGKDEIRREYVRSGDGSCAIKYHLPTRISTTARLETEEMTWTRGRTSVNESRSTIQPRTIVKIAEKAYNNTDQILPLISFQGAGRMWAQKRITEQTIHKNSGRSSGYSNALQDTTNLKQILNWCSRMEYIAYQKEQKIAEYEAVKKAVAQFMESINGEKGYTISYDKQSEELMLDRNGRMMSVSALSAGYQSLIWMVMDIGYRMALLNPFLKENISDTPGIVLIDELDMHIHPRWQWRIIDALKAAYPKIQFIATTHAPILFASAKDIWIVDVENEDIRYRSSHYGIDINTAVKMYQGEYEMAESVKQDFNAFYDLLETKNYDGAREKLEELEKEITEETPLIVDLRNMYELEVNWPEES